MGCLYVHFVGLHVSVSHMTIIMVHVSVIHMTIIMVHVSVIHMTIIMVHVSVIHMTIIRSVRAKEIAMQQRFPERNGIPLCFTLFSMMDIEL